MKLSGMWLLNLILERSEKVNFLQDGRFPEIVPLNKLEPSAREVKLTMTEQLSSIEPVRELLRTPNAEILEAVDSEGGKEPINLLELAEYRLSFWRLC